MRKESCSGALIEVSPRFSYLKISIAMKRRRAMGSGMWRIVEGSGEVTKGALIVTKSGGEVGVLKCCIVMRRGSDVIEETHA